MLVTEELEDWEDSRQIGRKRQWFTVDSALEQLARHKPVQRHYLMQLRYSKKLGRSNSPSAAESIFQHDDAEFLKHDAELKCSSTEDQGSETRATTPPQEEHEDAGDGGGGEVDVDVSSAGD